MIKLPLTEAQLQLVLELTRLRQEQTKRAVYLMLVKGLTTLEAAEQVTKEMQCTKSQNGTVKELSFSQQSASNARLRCERVIDLVNELITTLPSEKRSQQK